MEGTTLPAAEEELDVDYDSFDEQYDRPTERWAPLGQATSPAPSRMELKYVFYFQELFCLLAA